MEQFIKDNDSIIDTNSLGSFFTDTDYRLYNKFINGELMIYVNDSINNKSYEMFYYKDKIFKGFVSGFNELKEVDHDNGILIDDKLFALSSFMTRNNYRYIDIKLENIIRHIMNNFLCNNSCYETLKYSYYFYDENHIYRTPRFEYEYNNWCKRTKYANCYMTRLIGIETLITDIWETHFIKYVNNELYYKKFNWNTFCDKHFSILDKGEKQSINKFHKKNKNGKYIFSDKQMNKIKNKRKMIEKLQF